MVLLYRERFPFLRAFPQIRTETRHGPAHLLWPHHTIRIPRFGSAYAQLMRLDAPADWEVFWRVGYGVGPVLSVQGLEVHTEYQARMAQSPLG